MREQCGESYSGGKDNDGFRAAQGGACALLSEQANFEYQPNPCDPVRHVRAKRPKALSASRRGSGVIATMVLLGENGSPPEAGLSKLADAMSVSLGVAKQRHASYRSSCLLCRSAWAAHACLRSGSWSTRCSGCPGEILERESIDFSLVCWLKQGLSRFLPSAPCFGPFVPFGRVLALCVVPLHAGHARSQCLQQSQLYFVVRTRCSSSANRSMRRTRRRGVCLLLCMNGSMMASNHRLCDARVAAHNGFSCQAAAMTSLAAEMSQEIRRACNIAKTRPRPGGQQHSHQRREDIKIKYLE